MVSRKKNATAKWKWLKVIYGYIDDLTEENKKNKETITFICNELHNLQEQINKLKDELNHEENKH